MNIILCYAFTDPLSKLFSHSIILRKHSPAKVELGLIKIIIQEKANRLRIKTVFKAFALQFRSKKFLEAEARLGISKHAFTLQDRTGLILTSSLNAKYLPNFFAWTYCQFVSLHCIRNKLLFLFLLNILQRFITMFFLQNDMRSVLSTKQ